MNFINSLNNFNSLPLAPAVKALFDELNIPLNSTVNEAIKPKDILEDYYKPIDEAQSLIKDVYFLGMVDDQAFNQQNMLFGSQEWTASQAKNLTSDYDGLVVLAVALKPRPNGLLPTRSQLADISRVFNRAFPSTPVTIVFKYDEYIALANSERISRKDNNGEKIGKVSLLKDIGLNKTHTGHKIILAELAIPRTGAKVISTFVGLYQYWQSVLSVSTLNKQFYKEVANWYFWATQEVKFPIGGGVDENKRHSLAVIRLLTRLIFVWFIKEKDLVPDELFDAKALAELLKQDPSFHLESHNYYLAVLQNLFFATLNVPMTGNDEEEKPYRCWAEENTQRSNKHYLIPHVYRFKELFKQPDQALDLFRKIPYLNGGLFECLDRHVSDEELKQHPHLSDLITLEGKQKVLRIDGFSRRSDSQAIVPNKLFFADLQDIDLNAEYHTKNKKEKVRGLFNLLNAYKFTIEENTPLEEEVALDPELLGKVFENLLASFNEDTQTTARKQSGSFYTPREVVDYMVDEALITHILPNLLDADEATNRKNLETLLQYGNQHNPFTADEVPAIVEAIQNLKLLDPACGSGAFPMGALNKLVLMLGKLDPNNRLWREELSGRLRKELRAAKTAEEKEEAQAALDRLEKYFDTQTADYTRKLYLIEQCIFGVDIQPLAVQIAKLRFFIALIICQQVDKKKDNCGITPLPNLETKIIAADTLMPLRKVKKGMMESYQMGEEVLRQLEAELSHTQQRYFEASRHIRKKELRKKIQGLRSQIANELEGLGFESKSAQQLAHWDAFDQNSFAQFFDAELMFGVKDGFDVVVGNPPYVSAGAIRLIKPQLKDAFGNFFDGSADLFTYFYKQGFNLLKENGVLAYISSNKFMRTGYGEKTRSLLAKDTELHCVIDFGELPVFGASVDSAIVIFKKPAAQLIKKQKFKAVSIKDKEDISCAGEILKKHGIHYDANALSNEGWLFESPKTMGLLSRIKLVGQSLGDYVDGRFYYGIKTGLNEAFVIDETTKNRLLAEDNNLSEIIRPWLDGKEILRWEANYTNQYVILIESSANKKWPWSSSATENSAEEKFASTYPALYSHFSNYLDRLRSRADKGQFWWELRSCSYWDAFKLKKLVFNETSKEMHAFVDSQGFCINKTGFIIVSESSNYLLGILNSKVLDYYYRHIFPTWGDPWNGGRIQFRRERMVDVAIPNATQDQKALLEVLVDIVVLKTTWRNYFERLINGLVYELYFPEELHQAQIYLFDEVEKLNLDKVTSLTGDALTVAIEKLAQTIFKNDHPIYTMLFNLSAIDVVRTIESKE